MPGRCDPKRLRRGLAPPRAGRRHSPRLLERPSWEGLRPDKRFAARPAVGAVDASDLLGRDLIFGPIAPSEDDECRERADQGDNDQPPDLPDHAEATERREEGADKAGRAVPRHLDRLVVRLDFGASPTLGKARRAPIVVYALDLRQDRE